MKKYIYGVIYGLVLILSLGSYAQGNRAVSVDNNDIIKIPNQTNFFNKNLSGLVTAIRTNLPTINVSHFGATGAVGDNDNIIPDIYSTFDGDANSDRDLPWTGYGDADNVETSPAGSFVSYGLLSFPLSPSLGPTPNMNGFGRAPGLAQLPPDGALSLRLTSRGHGYTNSYESVTVVQTDGIGTPSEFLVRISTNGFRDGYIDWNRFHIITKPSGGTQFMRMAHISDTNSTLGGLKQPLVVGRTYSVSITSEYIGGTGTSSRQLYIGTSTNNGAHVAFTPLSDVEDTHTGTFVADTVGPIIIGLKGTSSAGEEYYIDDIVVYSGVDANDPDDEGAELQTIIDANPNAIIQFPPHRKYVLKNGLILRNGQILDGNGSTLKITVTNGSRDDAIHMAGNNTGVRNMRIVYTGTTDNGNGSGEGSQCIIGIGHFQYYDNPRIKNIILENLKLEGYGVSQFPQAINVGAADNVIIRNIDVPDNNGIYQAIGVYWSGDLVQNIGTEHPNNILIENITIGNLTGNGSGGTGANAMTIAGANNVIVRNIRAESVTGNFIRVTPGDLNHQRAKNYYGNSSETGIFIDNAICENVGRYGFRNQALTSYRTTNNPVIAENVSVSIDITNNIVIWPNSTNTAPDGSIVVFQGTSAPTGITFGEKYYVVWSSPYGFKLRAITDGWGNSEAIDITSSGTDVTASITYGQILSIVPVTVRGLNIRSSNGTYDGILGDGAQDLIVEKSYVRGFRHGVYAEQYTQNRNITIKDSIFTENRGNGIQVISGYNINILNNRIYGNGIDDLSDDQRAGIWVRYGSKINIENNNFGYPFGETSQRVGIKIENNKLELENVNIVNNTFHSSTTDHHMEINDPSSSNQYTFGIVSNNKWTSTSVITNLFQWNARFFKFPMVRDYDSNNRGILIGRFTPMDFTTQGIMGGMDDSSTNSSIVTRTEGAEKMFTFSVANPYSTNNPVQFLGANPTTNTYLLRLGYGYAGGQNKNITKINIGTAVSTSNGAPVTVSGVIDSAGRWAIGPNATSSTDTRSGLELKGTLPLLLTRLTTTQMNALIKTGGLLTYNTTDSSMYWTDGSVWNKIPTNSNNITITNVVPSSPSAGGTLYTYYNGTKQVLAIKWNDGSTNNIVVQP